jgi:hypothetical protein
MGLQHAIRAWEVCCRAIWGYVTTADSISVGRFDQNLAVQRIFPPPVRAVFSPSPTHSCSRCSRWPCMCPVRAVFSPYGSQWLRVYDFLLYSVTHAARKPTRGSQVMAIGVPQQGECVCTCMCELEATIFWTSSAHHMPERCAEELSRA